MAKVGMAKRSKHYDLDSLTDVSLAIFRDRGYDGTSMENLAAAAGISKAAFYHHVGGKEELLARGFDRSLDALFSVFEEESAANGAAVERVRYVVRRVIELEDRLLPEVSVLLRTRGNSRVERDALARRRQFDRQFALLIEEAQGEGAIRKDMSATLAARLLIGMCTSIVEWWQPNGSIQVDELADAVVSMAFDGLNVDSVVRRKAPRRVVEGRVTSSKSVSAKPTRPPKSLSSPRGKANATKKS